MRIDGFAEAVSRLVGYYEDEGGLDRETILAVLDDQAMREADEQ